MIPIIHGVQLLGKGSTKWGYMSSVNSQTGSFDNMSFEAIAKAVLTPYLAAGQSIQTVGQLNPLPFEKVQCQKGESCWDFLENLSRVRGIVIGSNEKGDYVFVGNHVNAPICTLKEGYNIKSMQCSINVDDQYVVYQAVGQKAASDSSGGAASQDQRTPTLADLDLHTSLLIWHQADQAGDPSRTRKIVRCRIFIGRRGQSHRHGHCLWLALGTRTAMAWDPAVWADQSHVPADPGRLRSSVLPTRKIARSIADPP